MVSYTTNSGRALLAYSGLAKDRADVKAKNGDTYYEIDTGRCLVFDGEYERWYLMFALPGVEVVE